MSLRHHQYNITPSMLDGNGVYMAEVPATRGDRIVVGVRVVAPELEGITTGWHSVSLVYRVGTPEVIVEAWQVAGESNGAAIGYTPGTYGPGSTVTDKVWGDYRVEFNEDVPLYVRYANHTDVALPSNVRVDVLTTFAR